jgi:TRAP-type C4-dicarboxylate transport system permease small subunit
MKIEQTAFWRGLVKFQKVFLIVFGLAVVIVLAVECLGRPVKFNFKGYEELLVIVVFWLYMFGCAYGSSEESHISADILDATMKDGVVKSVISLVKYFLTLVLGTVMLYWAIRLVQWSFSTQTVTTVYRIPTTIGQASMVVGLTISTFYNAVYMIREVKRFIAGRKTQADNGEVIA